ncbi:hypothetical protein E2C01_048067 [Portunus trituberculatus]|uniref:Uncharacterized protein n=1 Tax=Portunus trituberculatus TaxID=210409 RepID=A0A5B7G970_PORTR|nr:hypothetical protein [Portunus trituberculatus]
MLMTSVYTPPRLEIYSFFLTPSLWSPLNVASLSHRKRAESSPAAPPKPYRTSPLEGLLSLSVRSTATLGAPVKLSPVLPARRQVHPVISDLLARLQRRLKPLQWLTNYSSDISIPVARTIYISFIHSIVNYLSPALIQL